MPSPRGNGRPGIGAVIPQEGDFVLYQGSAAVLHSASASYPGAFLRLQTEGNLVVVPPDGQVVWNRFSANLVNPGPTSAGERVAAWATTQIGKVTADPQDIALFPYAGAAVG